MPHRFPRQNRLKSLAYRAALKAQSMIDR